jgi:Domain of unknown function (DUF4276)
MKIVLFVEGHTEKGAVPGFFKRWLDPQLPQPIGIKTVRFEGWRNYYDEIGKKVYLNLSGKVGADVVGAIGLLDLYGPTFYPKPVSTAAERYAWAKAHIEAKVAHPRFRQHFAAHETEAWLLSDPALLPKEVRAALPGRCAQPETVNFDEPPAKLLERLHRDKLGRSYKKITDGANLFGKLDPAAAQGKCPWLGRLLDDMLSLARGAAS